MTMTDWRDHLAQQGLTPGADAAVLSGPLPASGCCDLGTLALLVVAGPEAESFLQGQLTCDVHRLAAGDVLPAAHLTPKGRAIASFLAWCVDDAFYLQFPRALADPVTRRLRMFLLRSKATIELAGDDLVRVGTWGAAAETAVTELVGALPDAPGRQLTGNGITVLRLPGTEPRLELLLPEALANRVWEALETAGASACNEAAWRLLEIRNGIGWVRAETTETFLPQMLNYDLIGGISFSKGCYVGQEVVARLHHLGEVKRRAYPGTVPAPDAPLPGTALFSPGSSSRQGAGTIVDAIDTGAGTCAFLAVIERQAQAAGELHLGAADGPEVMLHQPPYPLVEAEQAGTPPGNEPT